MTYGQSICDLGRKELVARDKLALLFASLVTVAVEQSRQLPDSDHVLEMLAINFEAEAHLCAPLLDVRP